MNTYLYTCMTPRRIRVVSRPMEPQGMENQMTFEIFLYIFPALPVVFLVIGAIMDRE